MKRRTLGVLLRDDFEDGVGVGDVHESVSIEHETQQTAVPAVVDIVDSAEPVEIRLVQDDASDLAAVKTRKEQQAKGIYITLMDSKRP